MRWPNFFKPAWRHPNPERRREAVTTQQLEPSQLRQLAVGDPDQSVQSAAVTELVKRDEASTLEGLERELDPNHPARESLDAYLTAHRVRHWKHGLTPAAKLEVLRSQPRVQQLLPFIPLVDSSEQITLIEQRLATAPQSEVVLAVLTAPAFPAAVKERLVESLPHGLLAGLLSMPATPAGLGKKWRQRIELVLNKDAIAEARARETAAELTALHERLVRALADTGEEHPKHLRSKFSLRAWQELDPEGRHPAAAAYRAALDSLEQRIAAVESCELQIDELMQGVLAAAAEPAWDVDDNGARAMAAFEARLAALETQLPKALARTVQQRRDVVYGTVARAAEQRRADAQDQAAAAERARREAEREQQREQDAKQREQQRARVEERAREATLTLQQQIDDLMARATALLAPELPRGERASRLRALRAQWKSLQGPNAAALKKERDAQFVVTLEAVDELCRTAEEEAEWRRWAALRSLDQMAARAQSLLTLESVTEVANGLRTLRQQWLELASQGLGADGAQRARPFQEAWNRAFERVHAAREQCLAALTALTSAEPAPSVAEVKALQDAFRELDVPAGSQRRDLEVAFGRTVDAFFAQRRQQHAEQRQAREMNLEARRGLIAEAERILADQTARDQGSRLIELQRRWKEIGPVPRDHAEATWAQFHALCQGFFDKQRDERNQAVAAREALAKEMQAILEALADQPGEAFEARAAEVEALNARWQAAVVTKAQREPLETTFRELTKRFYDGVRRGEESKRSAAAQAVVRKLELVEEAELLAEGAASPEAQARFDDIEREWAELPGAAKAQEGLLIERLRAARARYGAAPSSGDFATSLARKREVFGKLAILHKLWSPKAEPFAVESGDLGRQLQLALSLKSAVHVPGDPEATRRRILREVGKALQEWEAAGAVAPDQRPALMQQFQQMMRGFGG